MGLDDLQAGFLPGTQLPAFSVREQNLIQVTKILGGLNSPRYCVDQNARLRRRPDRRKRLLTKRRSFDAAGARAMGLGRARNSAVAGRRQDLIETRESMRRGGGVRRKLRTEITDVCGRTRPASQRAFFSLVSRGLRAQFRYILAD